MRFSLLEPEFGWGDKDEAGPQTEDSRERGFVREVADKILWGTDWPHPDTASGRQPTEISPLRQIDDGRVFNQFATWTGTAAERKTILVENPQSLYGF